MLAVDIGTVSGYLLSLDEAFLELSQTLWGTLHLVAGFDRVLADLY